MLVSNGYQTPNLAIGSIQTFIDQKFSYAEHEEWDKMILLLIGSYDKCLSMSLQEYIHYPHIST
jgi:hypothetical protein